jgi:DNA polymerase beta
MSKAQDIIAALEVMHRKEKQGNVFKARAYARVISAVKDFPRPIKTMDDVDQIEGVGEGIRKKIQEVLETGHLEAADKINENGDIATTHDILQIYGVGPAKAKAIVEAGIRSIAALRKAVANGEVTLNEKQKIGLKHYDDVNKRIPRDEVQLHDRIISHAFHAVDPSFECQVVGSFRRGAADSGDVDVLVRGGTHELAAAIEKMRKEGYMIETLADGPKKFMGIARCTATAAARRIDLLLTPDNEFAFALLYFTGSDKFNVAMRKHALTKGWSLNEHGLTRTGKVREEEVTLPDFKTEEDIFTFLGVPWVPPTERSAFPKIT